MYNKTNRPLPHAKPRSLAAVVQIMTRQVILIALLVTWPASASALDRVTLKRDGKQIYVEGRLLTTAQDGGLLLLGRDGVLWAIPPEEKIKHTRNDTPFEVLSAEEMSKHLLAELPERFRVHSTAHYLILHDTSRAYAKWCGSLFERLYMRFTNYWSRKGFELTEPKFPLVAIVFTDKASYLRFSRSELGDAGESIIGYYSLRTNRMTMYDLTGLEALRRFRGSRGTSARINQILARPEAARQVATIIHEATHQIAFNCGLHTRYSDCPVWFSEGIAVFFETPDLRSSKGWGSLGGVNLSRLIQFRRYLPNRPVDSLERLIRDDKRFRDTEQATDAYAETWALTYFLLHRRTKQYIEYLQMLSAKKPLFKDGPQQRLAQFREVFGETERLDAEFVRYMTRVR